VINRLRRAALVVPGIALFGQARQDVQIGARSGKTQYQYTLQDPNVAELFQWAPVVLAKLAALRSCRMCGRSAGDRTAS